MSDPAPSFTRIARFNRVCSVLGLTFLLLTIGAKVAWYEYRQLPQHQDYPQYYMGGVIAINGAWDSMYPIPNPNAKTNPGASGNSELRPRYRELSEQHGVSEHGVRYMQPPPFTLLLIPLALMPFELSYFVWVAVLILAAWGVARQAGRILELCLGHPTRGYGILVLLICLSPQAHRWVRVGNMSVLMGWLIGFVVIEMSHRDGPRAAVAMVVGTLAKYALLVLVPLQVALRRWKTIGWEIALGVLFLGISLLVMGTGPYKVFSTEIAPTLGRTSAIGENSSLYAFMLRVQNIDDELAMPRGQEIAFRIVQGISILGILSLILLRPRRFWDKPDRIFAAAMALVAWLLIFSPIFWEHYHAFLAPLWGWLGFEFLRSRFGAVMTVLAIGMAYLPSSLLVQQLKLTKLPEPLFSHLLFSAVAMLILAIWRLSVDRADPRKITGASGG